MCQGPDRSIPCRDHPEDVNRPRTQVVDPVRTVALPTPAPFALDNLYFFFPPSISRVIPISDKAGRAIELYDYQIVEDSGASPGAVRDYC